MELVQDPQNARRILRSQCEGLRDACLESYDAAKSMDIKFEEWLHHACDLHTACVTTQSTANDKLVASEIETAVAQVSIDYQNKATGIPQDVTSKMKDQLESAKNTFKDPSDEFSAR